MLSNSPQLTDPIVVGKVSGHFGVLGWVKVFSETRPRDGILAYKKVWLKTLQGWCLYSVQNARMQGLGVVMQFEGFKNREQAALLIGALIAVSKDQLPVLKDEYYWSDLIDCRVINQEQVDFGQVQEVLETGANDVLLVQGERQRLIPFTQGHAIIAVDLLKKIIQVDWDADF